MLQQCLQGQSQPAHPCTEKCNPDPAKCLRRTISVCSCRPDSVAVGKRQQQLVL